MTGGARVLVWSWWEQKPHWTSFFPLKHWVRGDNVVLHYSSESASGLCSGLPKVQLLDVTAAEPTARTDTAQQPEAPRHWSSLQGNGREQIIYLQKEKLCEIILGSQREAQAAGDITLSGKIKHIFITGQSCFMCFFFLPDTKMFI